MFYNELNGKYYTTLSGMTRTFRKLGYTTKQYYDEFLKTENDGICLNCGRETKFSKMKYYKFCDTKCSTKYNAPIYNACKSEETKAKLSKSWEGRSKDWLYKRIKTIEEKYGMTYTEFKRMQFQKRLDNMSEEEHRAFYDKAVNSKKGDGKRLKEYVLNEEIVYVQGYEPQVLNILRKYYPESKLGAGRKIGFFKYRDSLNKERRYYPDILVDNRIYIEVKSLFTLGTDKNLLFKLQSVKSKGFIPVLAVLELDQIEMFEKNLIETISSQALDWYQGRFNDYPFMGVGHKQKMAEVLGIQNILDYDIVCSSLRNEAA